MYRYSPHMRGGDGSSSQLRRRVQSIFTMLLLVAVIALAIFGGNAMRYQSSAHELFVQKIQTECGNALQLCNTLSRTAGRVPPARWEDTAHIYSMQTIMT